MENHTPRMRFAFLAVIFGGVIILLGGYFLPLGFGIWVSTIVGILFVVFGIWEAVLVGYDKGTNRIDAEREKINAIANCSPLKLSALGMNIPTLDARYVNDVLQITWEGTGVPFEIFQEFIRGSKDEYVYPERDWPRNEESARNYELIVNRLIELGFLYPSTPAGPKSWLWKPNMKKRAWDKWMIYRVEIKGMDE